MGVCDSDTNPNQNLNNPPQQNMQNYSGKYFSNETQANQDFPILNNEVIVSENKAGIEDNYIKEKMLGEGSFGQVWLARHKTFGKEFALKIIEKGPYSNSKQIENEIAILKKIRSSLHFKNCRISFYAK